MKKTVFCHFFNEEYLLPWWLNHHKQFFDHGVMINYGSWDRSVDIIKEICPTWEIVDSRNEYFSYPRAGDIDVEVAEYETRYQGWKACLNVTEFLVGDYRLFDTVDYDIQAKGVVFVDEDRDTLPTYDKPLWEQKINAIDYDIASSPGNKYNRHARIIHKNSSWAYPEGRHYGYYNTDQLAIFYYAWSPWNVRMKMRRLQTGAKTHHTEQRDWMVSTQLSQTGFGRGAGFQSFPHNLYPPYALENMYYDMLEVSQPQAEMVKYYTDLMYNPTKEVRTWDREYDETRHQRRGRFYKNTFEPDDYFKTRREESKSLLLSTVFDGKPQEDMIEVTKVKNAFII